MNSTLTPEDLNTRVAWAEQLARTAGRMMTEFARSGELGVRIKLDKTQVTDADKAINAMIIERVSRDFPLDGVLGEEASAHADRNILWVCDPIDDTNGYILGLTSAMTSIALVEKGQPVAAAMYEPQLDKMFTAVKGGGAFENGRPIRVTSKDSLEGAQVAYSPSYNHFMPRQPLYELLSKEGVRMVPINGEAFKGALTATGMVDAHVFPGRSAHDVAAVKLIVEEAGGRVTDLRGQDQLYNQKTYGVIATNGHIHEPIVALMKQFGPENFVGY